MDDGRSPRLPFEIFLYIIAIFVDDRVPFQDAVYPDPPCSCVGTLKALSLTHRLLTGPAQRAMGSRLVVWSPLHVSQLLESPVFGEHTRELTVDLGATLRSAYEDELEGEEGIQELRRMVSILLKVLRRAPHLRALRVICPLFSSVDEHGDAKRLLEGVGAYSKSLNRLCWIGPEYADERERVNVEEVWQSLGDARKSLRVLSLRNIELRSCALHDPPWQANLNHTDSNEDDAEYLDLHSLSILEVDTKAFPTRRSVSYFRRLFGQGSLETLSIDLTSETKSKRYTSNLIRVLASAAPSTWSRLTHLRLRIGVGGCNADEDVPGLLEQFFSACTSLKYLQLWVGRLQRVSVVGSGSGGSIGAQDDGNFSRLFFSGVVASTELFVPVLLASTGRCPTVQEIHLGFFHIAGPHGGHRWKSLDRNIVRGLSEGLLSNESRMLKRVLVDTHEERYRFPCVRRACESAGCDFEKRLVLNSAFI